MNHDIPSRRSLLFILLAGCFLAQPLSAQTVFTVTTNAGDASANSLGWAVTSLNAAGDGAISFGFAGSNSVTLTQALAAANSSNVTLLGQDLNLYGQTSSQSQLLFQGNVVQADNLFFQNIGGGGAGLNMAVTADSWSASAFTNFWAGSGPATSLSGGAGALGVDGGSAAATIRFLTVNQGFIMKGGDGGAVTDTNGSGDQGGNGGSAFLSGSGLVMGGSIFQVNGGMGGSVTDLGTGSHRGGDGGSASVSFGAISSGPFGNFFVQGGQGGAAVTGGNGGAATALASQLFLTQGFFVQGGAGGDGSVVSGSGGSAYASIGSYSGTGSSNFKVAGGTGGVGSDSAGDGGTATLKGGSITINGPGSSFQVVGGNGGNLGPIAGPAANGGDGGAASVSLTNLMIQSASLFKMSGGVGGQGSTGTAAGNGGQGGDTIFNLGSLAVSTNTVLGLSSGYGGVGGSSTVGGTGGLGGDGGNLAVTLGNLTLGSGSILNLTGGVGGGGGTAASGGTGGDGGAGGDVSLSITTVNLSSGNIINITGGAGGSGGLSDTIGASGSNGQASASIGNLLGAGIVNMGGTATLQVAQGLFTGTLTGSEDLVKTSAATLTLGGANTYAGGTSILAGTLLVDTGGALGSGLVQVGNGTLLSYLNSADASNTSISNNAGATVAFVNSSTAGSASITNGSVLSFLNSSSGGSATILNNATLTFGATSNAGAAQVTDSATGTVYFTGNSTGGTASVSLVTGGVLDISAHSGGLTVGSIAGAGTVTLGGNGLVDGSNNLNNLFSGSILGSGSFSKIGTGTFTLLNDQTYSGGTSVLGGTLSIGATFAVGTGSVSNGAILMTNGAPLTFQVGGNYTQTSSGDLKMGLAGAGASAFDKMTVGGSVALDGTLDLFSYGGLTAPTLGSTLVLLVSGGTVSGTFQQVNENLTGVRFLPLYLSNAVELMSINPSFQGSGATANQQAIGADLDQICLKPSFNGLIAFLGTLNDADLRTALSQITPEDFASVYEMGFAGASARADVLDRRLGQLRADVDGTPWLPGFSRSGGTLFAANWPASKERGMALRKNEDWSGFLTASGSLFEVAADGNAAGYKTTAFGLTAAGVDLRLSRESSVGLMVGYGHGDATLGTAGTLSDDGGQAGLYGLYYSDGFYLGGLAEGGLHSYKVQRTGFNGIALGNTQGTLLDGSLEMGYAFDQGSVKMGPFGRLQYANLQLNAFSESGSQAPLSFPAQSGDSFQGQAGLQASGTLKMGTALLTPSLTVAYLHEFDDKGGTVQAGFGSADHFTVAGPVVGQDGVKIGAGADLKVSKTFGLSLDYQGELGRANLTSHQLSLGTQIGF